MRQEKFKIQSDSRKQCNLFSRLNGHSQSYLNYPRFFNNHLYKPTCIDMRNFRLQFDNPEATYSPGQTITGKVILTLSSTKTVRAIKITLEGFGQVHWREYVGRQRNSYNQNNFRDYNYGPRVGYYEDHQYHLARENYLRTQLYVLGSQSTQKTILPPGEHAYPFSVTLASGLPSSFESDHGYIRYTIKATLHCPWEFDHNIRTIFTVVSQLDLNQLPYASNAVTIEKSKNFGFLCCRTQPLSVKISLPVNGYVPRQNIPINVDVENRSGVRIYKIKFIFKKSVTYKADKRTLEIKRPIKEVSSGPVGGRETKSFEQLLELPATLTPSFLENCRIMNLEYKLKIKFCVSGSFNRNIEITTPIIIGTIPFKNYRPPQS